MTTLTYQCCFCGERIVNKMPDPCALEFTAGYRLPSNERVSQGFFCHMACFEKRLHSSVPIYAKDLVDRPE